MRAVVGALLLAVSQAGLACGLCIEDKIAAVYDHAAIARALGLKHRVAFFVYDGDLPVAEAGKMVATAASGTSGIDAGSLRVSADLASLSVAFDPSRTSAEALEQALRGKLARRGLRLELVKTVAR